MRKNYGNDIFFFYLIIFIIDLLYDHKIVSAHSFKNYVKRLLSSLRISIIYFQICDSNSIIRDELHERLINNSSS